jgi:circadian clock protein KaiB
VTVHRFRLYVLGETVRSGQALQQLRALCTARGCTPCDIEVVDVCAHPELADDARIVATPTLDRIEPPPLVRVIGDLSSDQLAMVLELPPHPSTEPEG